MPLVSWYKVIFRRWLENDGDIYVMRMTDMIADKITNHGQELNSTDWVPMMVSLVHGVVIKNVFRLHGLVSATKI